MELSQLDKSSYLKGLLIVAKKDDTLTDFEKKFLKGIASKLGFASDFYESTIRSLLSNRYIPENPIKFSGKEIAESFITDGIKLALKDKIITDKELEWLRQTASENDLDEEWFANKLKKIKDSMSMFTSTEYALYSII
ncbi:MAG: hypothetical protein P4L45_04060 [Ignavibacteriaceae bacterium]|nr:hypothetical protein [Ignavibacteriaceae bacterium]